MALGGRLSGTIEPFCESREFHGRFKNFIRGIGDGTKSMSERKRDNEVFEVWLVSERSKIQEGTLRLLFY